MEIAKAKVKVQFHSSWTKSHENASLCFIQKSEECCSNNKSAWEIDYLRKIFAKVWPNPNNFLCAPIICPTTFPVHKTLLTPSIVSISHYFGCCSHHNAQPRVSVQGVESLWGDCRFIPADWGS